MAPKRIGQAEKPRTTLVVPLTEAMKKISIQIDSGKELLSREIRSDGQLARAKQDHRMWYDFTKELLRQISNTNELANDFAAGVGFVTLGGGPPSFQNQIGNLQRDLQKDLEHLMSIHTRLALFPVIAVDVPASGPTEMLERIARRFHVVARQLRERRENRGTIDVMDEYDVQDLLHAILRLFFDDIRPEEWAPSYAGGASRMDFLLKAERTVVEAKKTRRGSGAREIGNQLLEDIGRYRAHPDCRSLFCFIYDPDGYIANPDGLERDLSRPTSGVDVKVVVAPKGQ